MALAHKQLDFESVPVRVSDKAAIAFSGQDKVPILKDGDHMVFDSWKIADYLESAYPDRPSLFGCAAGHGLARFVNAVVDRQMIPKLAPLLMRDVLDIVDDADAAHLRNGIEKAFRKTLEDLASQRDSGIVEFRRMLDPVRATLRTQPFLSGAQAAYGDYILFSLFQWARIVSAVQVLEPDDAIAAWRERMLDLFDGFARREQSRLEAVEAAS
ncbi:glutathione S-transferase N-terminal domain-containing protein [Pseudorhodoplanes sp.]|uniref:glutathione S-transferase N-terminal domain-containing protein n=1 Tax=Pseudorhodoplanes sp. TaxID=1934341 RepID=UPI003D0F9571